MFGVPRLHCLYHFGRLPDRLKAELRTSRLEFRVYAVFIIQKISGPPEGGTPNFAFGVPRLRGLYHFGRFPDRLKAELRTSRLEFRVYAVFIIQKISGPPEGGTPNFAFGVPRLRGLYHSEDFRTA